MGAAFQQRADAQCHHPRTVFRRHAISVLRPDRSFVANAPSPVPTYILFKDQQRTHKIVEVRTLQIQLRRPRHQQQVRNPRQGARLGEEVGNVVHGAWLAAASAQLHQKPAQAQHGFSSSKTMHHRPFDRLRRDLTIVFICPNTLGRY